MVQSFTMYILYLYISFLDSLGNFAQLKMYILASDFFEKTINTFLKIEIRVVCREFLAFKYVLSGFFETNQMIIYICTSEIGFWYIISICICVGR